MHYRLPYLNSAPILLKDALFLKKIYVAERNLWPVFLAAVRDTYVTHLWRINKHLL